MSTCNNPPPQRACCSLKHKQQTRRQQGCGGLIITGDVVWLPGGQVLHCIISPRMSMPAPTNTSQRFGWGVSKMVLLGVLVPRCVTSLRMSMPATTNTSNKVSGLECQRWRVFAGCAGATLRHQPAHQHECKRRQGHIHCKCVGQASKHCKHHCRPAATRYTAAPYLAATPALQGLLLGLPLPVAAWRHIHPHLSRDCCTRL